MATKKKKLIPKTTNFLTDTPPSNGMPTEGIARTNRKPKAKKRRGNK